MLVLADTNVLLRRIDRNHAQHVLAGEAITNIVEKGDVICVTAQNLIEIWAVCTRPIVNNGLGIQPPHASRILARVEHSVKRLTDDSDSVYLEWRMLVANHNVSGKKSHDARLVAAMMVHKVTHILTFNTEDFKRYPGIVTLDPRTPVEPID